VYLPYQMLLLIFSLLGGHVNERQRSFIYGAKIIQYGFPLLVRRKWKDIYKICKNYLQPSLGVNCCYCSPKSGCWKVAISSIVVIYRKSLTKIRTKKILGVYFV